ncbi:acetylcholine receptor subunit alpha-like [Pollicipes pollicipes]|uniref:acetylcholine receptor subunit alpha-like n=1 Tax=Pollicipes pollicipes TaxID=41117 RepID=UPI0018856146|nr:acetylcholine receptor subunit alpha-like [Pollicipes pollicipes]
MTNLKPRLLADLLANYDPRSRAVLNASETVSVSVGLDLQHVDLHVRESEATLQLWVSLQWVDPALRWEPADYGGIHDVRLPRADIWTPDVMMYNMLPRPRSDWLTPTLVIVFSSGEITHKVDSYRCDAKLGSWAYDGFAVDFVSGTVDLSNYVVTDPLWELHDATVRRNEKFYTCCEEPYIDLTLTIEMRRAGSFAVWPSLPVVVSAIASAATFLVPPDSPQNGALSHVCCLTVAPDAAEKADALDHEWTALAELLDRLVGAVFFTLLVVSSATFSMEDRKKDHSVTWFLREKIQLYGFITLFLAVHILSFRICYT